MYLEVLRALLALSLLYNNQCRAAKVPSRICMKVDTRTIQCNYIPGDIDYGISRVYILNVKEEWKVLITRANFSSANWKRVDYLEFGEQENRSQATFVFQNKCFANLTNLKDLRIHVQKAVIYPDTFVGLDSVKTLDLSNCIRLKNYQFIQALNGTNKLPRLQTLIISKLSSLRGAYALNESFVDVLLPRNITHLDISRSQILMLNMTALAKKLKHLAVVNMSFSVVNDFFSHHLTRTDVEHLKLVDFSHVVLPAKSMPIVPGEIEFANANLKYSQLHPSDHLFLSPTTVNASGVIPAYSSISIVNSTVTIDIALQWNTQNFVIQGNGLRRLGIDVICDQYNMSSLRQVDLSNNKMEYLNPSLLHCMPNLVTVDLSKNNLYQMTVENISLFEKLFSGLPNLTYIGLADNSLTEIPTHLFSNSKMVEAIDLSRNKLQQITFALNNLDQLQTLDLCHNSIQILNSLSLSRLDSIPHRNTSKAHFPRVIFTANPISCSTCKAKPYIKWLTSTNLVDASSQNLKCINEDHHLESINDSTLRKVEKICTRKTIIIAGCVTAAVMFILISMLLGIIYVRKRRKQRMQNRVNVINRLREGEGQHEFVAYLAYSSDDQDFVEKNVLDQLRENLQLMTGIDRDLICTGDVHLRFGFDINSETIRCLDRSSVVIVVASRSFCTSEYCHNELDQAYMKKKPIVLMFKERVEEDLMMPTMKELYHNNVRMLWSFENGKYVLKSTWDNVCTSVLDLVQCDV